jgi:hypothetical protein
LLDFATCLEALLQTKPNCREGINGAWFTEKLKPAVFPVIPGMVVKKHVF